MQVLEADTRPRAQRRSRAHVAIIGAGPYGLAAAAHLRAAGVETRVFGEAMSFWQDTMPVGMLLRSAWRASNISAPGHALSLDAYQAARGNQLPRPLPLADFVAYGQWFQRQIVPDLDPRLVAHVAPAGDGFELTLDDGEVVAAQRVVVAAGIQRFAWRPPQFDDLPRSLASHAVDHRDLGTFRGDRVLVLGGGQSALESAALLHEAGAEVEVVLRGSCVRWLSGGKQRLSWFDRARDRLLRGPSEVGPQGLSWVVELPDLFRLLPRTTQERVARVCILPAGAAWLLPRLRDVPLNTGRSIVSAVPAGDRLRVQLDDGSERELDHLVLATGYQVDVARYRFLAPPLVRSLARLGGFPWLGPGLESSVPGLHFVGAAAAGSFGPLMRFVAGTKYAAPALAHGVCHPAVAT
ncbi:MAG: NAD(P)-binding domain-containing protein [Chloroflexi bacterium]|nr:NAD(P)-binding domain-containing protein [Chloroflexota bacterium]